MQLAESTRHYLRGLLMGTADIIPGVSGGTMALVLGIYERLLAAISGAASAAFRLFRGDPAGAWRAMRAIDVALLVPLGAGIATALLAGAAVIPGLLEDHPVPTRALFFGLIAGSILIPWRAIRQRSATQIIVLLVAAGAAFLFTGLPDRTVGEPSLPVVFASAALAICAMILPGISGAFLLVVLGMYEVTLDAVHERDVVYVGVFLAGAATGITSFAWFLRRLLDRAHDVTMAALTGLMAGSLRALWPFIEDDRSLRGPAEGEPVALAVALGLGGFAFVLVLARMGSRAEARQGQPE